MGRWACRPGRRPPAGSSTPSSEETPTLSWSGSVLGGSQRKLGAHSVVPAIHVDHLAGGGGEIVAEQGADRSAARGGIGRVPAQWSLPAPGVRDQVEAGNALGGDRAHGP